MAILARGAEPVPTRGALPGDRAVEDARYIEAAVRGVLIGCLYAPNGNPQPGSKFDAKLRWMERLLAHAAALLETGAPVVLAGDYNVIPTERDMYRSRSFARSWAGERAAAAGAARAQWARLIGQGWTDALPAAHPDGPPWTFWGYLRDSWSRDAALRIDRLLLSPSLAPKLVAAGVDRAVRGRPNASDHAPAWIELSS